MSVPRTMSPVSGPASSAARPRRVALVGVVAAAGVVAIALLAWVYAAQSHDMTALDMIGLLALVTSLLAFVLSGAVILARRPGNVIGWLLLIPGIVDPLAELATRWLASIDPPPTSVTPFSWLLLVATGCSWLALIFPIFHLLLVFPSGRLPGPRWRLAAVLEVVMIVTFVAMVAFSAELGPLVNDDRVWTVANPVGFILDDPMQGPFAAVWGAGLLGLTVVSASAVAIRFRRGSVDEREQLKWPLAATMLFGSVYAVGAIAVAGVFGSAGTAVHTVTTALFELGLAAIPVSVAIAIFRYRLYEIDRIISRGLSWILLTGTLLVAYAVTVVVLTTVIADVTGSESVPVAAATLVAAALFQPLRSRIQRGVDRRFHRARYDGERIVSAFEHRLREEVDMDTLAREIGRVATETVRPAGASVWLRHLHEQRAGS